MTRTKVLEIKDGIWDNVKKWVRDSGVLQRESMCGTEGTDTSDQIQLSHGLGQVPWSLFFAHQSCLLFQTS